MRTKEAVNKATPEVGTAPRPQVMGTALFLVGLCVTGLTLHGKTPSAMAAYVSYGVSISIALSIMDDLRLGFRNLVRPDLMAMLALFFLTLFEFFFHQPIFDDLASGMMASEKTALIACLIGFAGLGIGRHLPNLRKHPLSDLFTRPVPKTLIVCLFWGSIILGFLYMFLSVDFSPALFFKYLLAPRFTQPWGRPRLGDWKALLHEIEMVVFLAPPLAGIILARRREYNSFQVFMVAAGLLFVFFYGFATGTRNLLASYIVTFLIGYAFSMRARAKKELVFVAVTCAVVFFFASVYMLRFRQVGLENYVEGNYQPEEYSPDDQPGVFIDYNLYTICQLVEVFPKRHAYLGWEIPYLALIRPIPRALWAGKPEGMSLSIEDAVGVEGFTLAASFVGEAYMAGGMIGVFAAGLFFGVITGWWGHLASPRNSEFGILSYASGFFAAVISMRSLLVFTTALLPTIVSVIAGYLILQKARQRRAEGLSNRPMPPPRLITQPPRRAGR